MNVDRVEAGTHDERAMHQPVVSGVSQEIIRKSLCPVMDVAIHRRT